MPACARKEIVRKGEPGIYHCSQRCVRQAWLLSNDSRTGLARTHRRDWVVERLMLLARCFMIDVCFYAIMSNHLHVVLRTHPDLANRLSDEEVARRWLRAYPGKWALDGVWVEPSQEKIDKLLKNPKRIAKLRRRLSNISWFMGALSEYIARRANREDGTDGRFFSDRFKCRECTNEAAVLICGMYVDLNQIRAGESLTPETSRLCSIWSRLQAELQQPSLAEPPLTPTSSSDAWLARLTLRPTDLGEVPSATQDRASDKGLLSMTLEAYAELLDYVGRQHREGKRGAIPAHLAPILERLGLKEQDLAETVHNFPNLFRRIAGHPKEMMMRAKQVGRKTFHGISAARKVFCDPVQTS